MHRNQKETLVHLISILNVTRYATQINRQLINILMNTTEKTHQDITIMYNIMHSLYSSISYQQIVLHIISILANLQDSLHCMQETVLHIMYYQCSHHGNILTTCITCSRFEGDAAVPAGITLICPGEALKTITPHPSIQYFDYNQHAVPHHSIFTCHHAMNHLGPLQHLTEHSKSSCCKHICTRVQNIAAPRRSLEWDLTSPPGQYTFSTHWQAIQADINSDGPMNPFLSTDESIGETVSVWTLFSHAGVYILAIGLLIPGGLGIFCCYFFWCQPARLVCHPLQSGSMQYTTADDNVEAAPIYRFDGKAGQPIARPHENHDLHIEQEPTQRVDRSIRFTSEQFLHLDHWIPQKSRECNKDIRLL